MIPKPERPRLSPHALGPAPVLRGGDIAYMATWLEVLAQPKRMMMNEEGSIQEMLASGPDAWFEAVRATKQLPDFAWSRRLESLDRNKTRFMRWWCGAWSSAVWPLVHRCSVGCPRSQRFSLPRFAS